MLVMIITQNSTCLITCISVDIQNKNNNTVFLETMGTNVPHFMGLFISTNPHAHKVQT